MPALSRYPHPSDVDRIMRNPAEAMQLVSTEDGRKCIRDLCDELQISGEILVEISQVLEHFGCSHGKDMSSTPPMMYPETVACAIRHAMSMKDGRGAPKRCAK